jgi:hypothetical protein
MLRWVANPHVVTSLEISAQLLVVRVYLREMERHRVIQDTSDPRRSQAWALLLVGLRALLVLNP